MKNHDDLQRFREKTQTLDIAFKDMSGQLQKPAEKSQWALIRQLANDEAATPFNGSQRIDLPQPQPLRGNIFSAPEAVPSMQPAASQPLTAKAQPAASLTGSLPSAAAPRGSIMESLAASSPPVSAGTASLPASPARAPQPQNVLTQLTETLVLPIAHAQPAEMPQPQNALAQSSESLLSQIARAPQPAEMPQPQHALAPSSETLISPVAHLPSPHSAAPAQYASAQTPPSAAPGRFSGLFRARHSEPASLPKETLLKPLLEKIALCR